MVALGAMGLITRAYRNRFGRVRTGDAAVQVVTVVTAVALFMLSGIAAGLLTSREAPIWPQGLQLALLLTVMLLLPPLLRRRPADLRIRRYWQVMCVLVALASLVPVGLFTGGVHPLNATPELGYAAFLWVLGLCFLIGGILDHRLLVRSLHTPPAEER